MKKIIDDLSSNPLAFVLDDGWVLYHGTSESYSASIESFGLGHQEGVPSYWDDVQSFITYWKIFKLESPAFVALAGFSQDHEGIRAVSLAETFERAARYAVKEPGGETIALMRRAISEITEEIRNPELIKTRLHEQRTCIYQLAVRSGFDSEDSWDAVNGTIGPSFQDIDQALSVLECPEVLFSELDKFKSYSSARDNSVREHPPVVYAVRIYSVDISHLSMNPTGLNYRGVLPPERLLARVRISDDRVVLQPGAVNHERLEARGMWRKRLGH
ncbi:MAG: hypothetical protein F4Z57_06835 [Gemmatimonadetes bacterium]|nr:hypothetical protein [Gemmatimonadota bacterium]MYC73372.1 hypothetical protein [Gemmatimonadota bacterium]MYI61944.1 hypothetical protein [Gemmatimonadota bacterium]